MKTFAEKFDMWCNALFKNMEEMNARSAARHNRAMKKIVTHTKEMLVKDRTLTMQTLEKKLYHCSPNIRLVAAGQCLSNGILQAQAMETLADIKNDQNAYLAMEAKLALDVYNHAKETTAL